MGMKISNIGCSINRAVGLMATLFLGGILCARAQYIYSTLSVPGYGDTYAEGISGNNIVGFFGSESSTRGFLYNGSSYTTLTVPSTLNSTLTTWANGVDGNNIVGYYQNTSGRYESFLYNGTSYSSLMVPGSLDTYAGGISGNDIVGTYDTTSSGPQGFWYNGSTYTTLSVPGAENNANTHAYGVSGNNIVGSYFDSSGHQYGFLFNGSSYTTLSVPGSVGTVATGVSGNNIVGYYQTGLLGQPGSATYGFLYNGISYTTLSAPGAVSETQAFGISGNNIVGYYVDGSYYTQGFLAVPVPEPSILALLAIAATAYVVCRIDPGRISISHAGSAKTAGMGIVPAGLLSQRPVSLGGVGF